MSGVIPFNSPVDFLLNEIRNFKIQALSSDPGSPQDGQVWLNTTSNELKARINGATLILQTGLITSADIQDGTITDTDVAAANKDGSAGVASLRTIGTGALQAMAGNTRLDTIAAPTGAVALNGQKITGLADPTSAQDAVTKAYADSISAGLDPHASVRAATTANITLSGAQTIDGVSIVAGDRVLVKNQTTTTQNGIYVAAAGAWSRATDADTGAELSGGSFVFAEEGTANADTGWVATHNGTPVLGTDAITFAKFSAAAVSALTRVAADITGDGATTAFAITHNLGTLDINTDIWEVSTGDKAFVAQTKTSTNVLTVTFSVAPANAKVYRAVIIG